MAAAEEPLAPKLFWWEGAQALPTPPVWEQEQDRMVLGTGSGGRGTPAFFAVLCPGEESGGQRLPRAWGWVFGCVPSHWGGLLIIEVAPAILHCKLWVEMECQGKTGRQENRDRTSQK